MSISLQFKSIPSVSIDNKNGMKKLISHLIKKHKYRKLVFIRGPEGNSEAQIRFNAYIEVLNEFKILYNPELVLSGVFSYESGRDAMRIFLDRNIDFEAVIAANDDMALAAMHELEERGIGFCSLQESIDTTTSGGKLVFHIFGALAEFERNIIIERTQAGLKAARTRGRLGGRPKAMDAQKIKMAKALMDDRDISVKEIKKVNMSFSSRRDARWREYIYNIVSADHHSVFLKKYSILVTRKLDTRSMSKAAGAFLGKNDFSPFASPSIREEFTVREIYEFSLDVKNEGLLEFKIRANAFLYNMARIMVIGGRPKRPSGKKDTAKAATPRAMASMESPPRALR